jgi:hypothetical protein
VSCSHPPGESDYPAPDLRSLLAHSEHRGVERYDNSNGTIQLCASARCDHHGLTAHDLVSLVRTAGLDCRHAVVQAGQRRAGYPVAEGQVVHPALAVAPYGAPRIFCPYD